MSVPIERQGGIMWNKYKSIALSYFAVKILMLLTLAAVFTIPFLVSKYCETVSSENVYLTKIWLTAALYASMLPVFVSEVCLNKLLTNVKKDLVFIHENVKYMRYVSWCCFAVGVIFFVLGFRLMMSFAIAAAAIFFGFIFRVLKNVFYEAVVIKSENDLTI